MPTEWDAVRSSPEQFRRSSGKLDPYPLPEEDHRWPTRKDRDRILYSSAFRRLAGVTQVVTADEGEIFHNRLTHSLKVAQLCRTLAERLNRKRDIPSDVISLGGVDVDACEAAGLAHDLGHPPFGHAGEATLDEALRDHGVSDGFEGNAQSFRIVTFLARRGAYPGLDLTRVTLRATVKYPWYRHEPTATDTVTSLKERPTWRKFGSYRSEKDAFEFAMGAFPDGKQRSIEADLMDWADDVTYAVHDAEDFYRAGIMPLDRLCLDAAERKNFVESTWARWDIVGDKKNLQLFGSIDSLFSTVARLFDLEYPTLKSQRKSSPPPETPYCGADDQRIRIRAWVGGMVERFVNAIEYANPFNPHDNSSSLVAVNEEVRCEVSALKELTWHYVINGPELGSHRKGHQRAVRECFEILYREAIGGIGMKSWPPFPKGVRSRLEHAGDKRVMARIVADYIAGMTDRQLLEVFHRLTGIGPGPALGRATW